MSWKVSNYFFNLQIKSAKQPKSNQSGDLEMTILIFTSYTGLCVHIWVSINTYHSQEWKLNETGWNYNTNSKRVHIPACCSDSCIVVGITVAVGVPLAAIGLMLAVALPWVSAVELLRTGCTGADCLCWVVAGDDRGRMFAVRTGAVSAVLELE